MVEGGKRRAAARRIWSVSSGQAPLKVMVPVKPLTWVGGLMPLSSSQARKNRPSRRAREAAFIGVSRME